MARPVSYRDIVNGLREVGLDSTGAVMVHVDLPAFGELRGGAETLVGALIAACGTIVTPTFTFQALTVPLGGPPDNGLDYREHEKDVALTEMFHPDLPAHPGLGPAAEAVRRHPQAVRSVHPALSFAAVGPRARDLVAAQSVDEPWGPLNWLYDNSGDVLLMGADHTANVAIHLAEKIAGRKQFVRWAVDRERAYRLEGFPGCSRGFNAIAPKLAWVAQQTTVGQATLQRIPIRNLVDTAVQMIQSDRAALLCDAADCVLCNAVRASLA